MALSRLSRFKGDARGVAAVEAALAFPFLVLMGAGLFEYGSVFYNYELLQTGVRDAARYLARTQDTAATETAARNLALYGNIGGTGAPRVSWWQASAIQVTYRTTANPVDSTTGRRIYRGGDPIKVVRVSTAVDYNGLGLLTAVGLGPVHVTAAHEERYVGD